jgi:NADH:ubiquinone oxidoreductase subunit
MSYISKLCIRLSCQKTGTDEFGNEYFEHKNGKRFVIYNGIAEASKVPAEWHGWLHYSSDISPSQIRTHKFSWQKIHLPNLTGTKNAYLPQNSSVKNTSYGCQSWEPDNKN